MDNIFRRNIISILAVTALFTGIISISLLNADNTFAATKKVKVTYKVNGGKFSAEKYTNKKSFTKKINRGKKVGKIPKVTRTGYKLKGWYTKKSGGKRITEKSKIKKNTVIYARWTAKSYTVTFNANGGTISKASQNVKYNSKYGTLPSPARKYYNFLGWYTSSQGGSRITDSSVYKTAGSTALYARWEKQKVSSGMWGTAPWTLYADGLLEIGGGKSSGSYDSSPWVYYEDKVSRVEITDKVVLSPTSQYIFGDFKNLKEIKGLDNFDTSNVFRMAGMFSGCKNLTELDLSTFDTENVDSMYEMFSGCDNLQSIKFSGDFRTTNVNQMSGMFADCSRLEELDLSTFRTQNVEDMGSMFRGCSKISEFDLSEFDTTKVTHMEAMFSGCEELTELDLSSFNTVMVEDTAYMFYGCGNLKTADFGSNFDTSSVYSMAFMFGNCSNLSELTLKKNFSSENVFEMNNMFENCTALKELNLSGFDTTITEAFDEMFSGCSNLEKLNISKFNTENDYTKTVRNMFNDCDKLAELIIGEDFRFYVEGVKGRRTFAGLPDFSAEYSSWDNDAEGSSFASSEDFMNGYDGTTPGTYKLMLK